MPPRNRSGNLRFGENTRKVHPKVRMVSNGNANVNAVRAGASGSVCVSEALAELPVAIPCVTKSVLGEARGRQRKIPRAVVASVFIRMNATRGKKPKLPAGVKATSSRRGNLIAAEIPLDRVREIARDEDVAYVEMGEALSAPAPLVENRDPAAPKKRSYALAAKHLHGKGVLIGIIDVQGFDFAHSDFMEDGKTRFVRIWDQGGDARPSPEPEGQFSYGAEFTDAHMNAAIKASPQLGLPATDIEKQSQTVEGSHGTHVASIAAGNRGVCRKSRIAAVLVALGKDDEDRRSSFYDSS
ncbi:MAG TPA: S8 family serine peptidase, partial [Thermoanaerobaculia bacterium]